jgi:hypothetical protein
MLGKEALPIISRVVDYSLNNIRPNHGRRAIGEAKKAEELN